MNNNYLSYGLIILLVLISTSVIGWSEKNAVINKFNEEKNLILKEISSHQDKKEFFKADAIISKYLKVMPENKDLQALKKENSDKKVEEEKQIAARKQAEMDEFKRTSSASDGSQPGYKYVLVNSSTSRQEGIYSSYGACSSAKSSKGTKDWQCIGRPKFANE